MTKALKFLAALLLALPVFALAQRAYSQPELDQMLAPVALYPDALLSQVLMAATHPVGVIEAARWSRANPGLQGDDAVRAVDFEDWDPSVKSLLAFPQVLARMDENLDWTRKLGEAFLSQEPHVMDTVQQLRRRAQAAGNLQSGDQPVYWAPWPGYARAYRPGIPALFWWGAPAGLSVNFFFGNFDWHHRHVRVVHPTAYYYRPPQVVNRTRVVTPHRWQHEPPRREVVIERRPVPVPQQAQAQPRPQPAARTQPLAERREPRQSHRHEPRNDHRHKGRERS